MVSSVVPLVVNLLYSKVVISKLALDTTAKTLAKASPPIAKPKGFQFFASAKRMTSARATAPKIKAK